MEASPLTQQSRPEIFQPKVVQLYETLFKPADEAEEPSEGFWREFFLLPPDSVQLHALLDGLSPDETLGLQTQTRHIFLRAIRQAASNTAPSDAYALDTLTIFLTSILSKKYTNPSSDVITVLAGLDEVDRVISEFVTVLDNIIRNGSSFEVRRKAVRVAIAMTSGAYKTSLVSYFTHRDLFPSMMKYVNDSETALEVFDPFLLLGLLANYNKFEFQNPYQLRLDDFVNEASIQKIAKGVGLACGGLRNGYIAVQDDIPEGWSLTNTLIFFGLRALTPGTHNKANPPTAEEAKGMFAELPVQEAAILLATYDFTNSNKLFGYQMVHMKPEKNTDESPFSSFLSLSSYLLQHAYRSTRVSHYAELSLYTLRILVEDPTLCKHICNDDGKRKVRICRQRQPFLPLVGGDRVLATVIFDIMIDTITHNLRRRLDVNLYCQAIAITLRLLSYLSTNKIRLNYHWSELWRTLLSLMRFLTTYANDLTNNPKIHSLTSSLAELMAFCVSGGDTFLPDPSSYDDLFYKLVETGPVISKFRDLYYPSTPSKSSTPAAPITTAQTQDSIHVAAVNTLLSVSTHFYALLFQSDGTEQAATAAVTPSPKPDGEPIPVALPSIKKKNLSPREVHRIIKQGYDTLSIQPPEGLNAWIRWRETDWKGELKRAARCAVDDARHLVS
ncbi:hypothetical protein N7481_003250 [Penicillium waksmanii]|uniref:uncharacterized protein n=1 Tax=Penicillium waksmanii TaxID=69791 RepID=UPI002546B4FF|nr:uncharacterized protein N7481_003250 [Penicillium waksmanii]KAJ5988040.1 hypothetical protein N7481_003250 [Penicillium waksmanii]